MLAFITELNNENYKEFTKEGIVLVDIWAPWCQPCKQISPIVDELSVEFNGVIKVCKIDVDQNKEIIAELGVRNIPAILIYKDGEIVDKSVGMTTKAALTELINKYI